MALTLAEANRILEGAVAKAEELGIKVNVAVCDDGGRLKAFARMDGAGWAGMYGSQGKAVASAATGRASGDLQERADTPIYRGIVAAEGGHMILSKGAVPIIRDGQIVGACGVGGGTSDEDEVCASAGVSLVTG
jgi:glc operon protein GlcG